MAKQYCVIKYNERLRKAIKLRMQERGLTGSKLSQLAGLAQSRVSRYLNGDVSYITQPQVLKIAEILNIEVSLTISFV